jgi:hypothetical protein
MPFLLPPTTAPRDLRDRLEIFRWRSRTLIAWQGGLMLAAAWLGGLVLTGVVDLFADLPAILRASILVAALVGSAMFVLHRIIRPWAACADDLLLALRIEKQFPELNDALASAIEFEGESESGSAALRAATRRFATREAADCDFDQLNNSRTLVRAALVALFFGLAAIVLAILAPEKSRNAVARLVDPFGNHGWPPDTQMTIIAPEWLARGEPFQLRGELRGVVPDRTEFHFAIEVAPAITLTLPVSNQDDLGSFNIRLEPNRVPRTFRYQVRANDATTPWRTVPVLSPPELVDRDGRPSPQVHLTFPAYTELPPAELSPGGSSIEGITGVAVQIRAAANRPLARAWMELTPDAPVRATSALAALGAVHPADAIARLANGLAVVRPATAVIDGDGHRFDLAIVPSVSSRYLLRFEDTSGLAGRREFDLRMIPDPPPFVHLERPSAGRDSLAVLPDATVTLVARVEDSVFAVRSVWFEYRISAETRVERQSLVDAPVAAPPHVGNVKPSERVQILNVERAWQLKAIRRSDGQPLQDGDIVTLVVAADDFDDVTTTKPAGRSHEVELRIVSPAALRAIVQKAQAEIQRELKSLHGLQRDAHDRASIADNQRRQTGTLGVEDQDRLKESAQLQQQIRQRVGTASEGLRATVEQLRQTFRNNPLPDAAAEHARADALAAELERLVRDELEPIEPLLATARTERGPVAAADRQTGPLPAATRLQADAERALRDLSERMEAWSEARELRAEAALIERDQERVARQRAQLEAQPGVRGAAPNGLRPPEQEALARLTERQSAVADRANELVQKLNQRAGEKLAARIAKEAEAQKLEAQPDEGSPKAPVHPRAQAEEARDAASDLAKQAQALAKARDIAEGSPSLAAQIQGAMRALELNKLGDAKAAQESATQTLRRVQDALAEAPERDADRLAKRLKQAEQEVNDVADEQERLQKRATDARAMSDPVERQDVLEKLAREQEQLRERADDLAQRLSRMRQESAAQNLRRATRAMDQAREQIEQSQPAEGKQEEALDRLDDAQSEIEQARKRLDDELQRERRAKILDALSGFVARQTALAAESERVFQTARTEKLWTRALQKSLIEMGQAEAALGGDLDRFAESSVKDAKVVVHGVK